MVPLVGIEDSVRFINRRVPICTSLAFAGEFGRLDTGRWEPYGSWPPVLGRCAILLISGPPFGGGASTPIPPLSPLFCLPVGRAKVPFRGDLAIGPPTWTGANTLIPPIHPLFCLPVGRAEVPLGDLAIGPPTWTGANTLIPPF